MTDAGAPSSQPNVSALVEALDQRARQAGSEGATNVLRGMLGSLAEALGSIEARLDRIEDNIESGSGGAGGGAMAEQIQAGITAFNARLGRLEEAFVQAVEDSGSGTESVVEQFRRSVDESIRAQLPPPVDLSPLEHRLAEMAARVDSLAAAPTLEPVDLGSLERRLDEVAARLTSPAPVMEPVDLAPLERRLDELGSGVDLSSLERRLDDLAQRLDSLPQPAPPPPAPDLSGIERRLDELPRPEPVDLSHLERRLDDLAQRLDSLPQPALAPAPDLSGMERRLDDLARRLDSLPQPPPPPPAPDLSGIERRLDELSHGGQPPADLESIERRLDDLRDRMQGLLDRADPMPRVHQRLDELEQRLQPSPPADLGPVRGDIALLRGELESLARADSTAELKGTLDHFQHWSGEYLHRLEQRLDHVASTVSKEQTDSAPEVIAAVERTNEQLRARVASLLSAQSAEVQRRMQQLDEHLAATGTTLEGLKSDLEQRPTTNEIRDQFSDVVRREAELLTQRVVSLTVMVEAMRDLLDDHVEETSNSLGRRATEVGRRLAADFGLRGSRRSNRSGTDPRELGRGGH